MLSAVHQGQHPCNHGVEVAIAKINIDSTISVQKDDSTKPNAGLYNRQGTIVAESRGGNFNVSVPYEAQIYRVINRGVLLTNNFPFGLAIWNVTLDEGGREAFEVRLVSPIVLLASSQTLPVLLLKYLRQQPSNFTTHCTVHTNVTSFDIPIVVFDGKLEIQLNSLSQSKFDFGVVRVGDRRSILMTIENRNPVPITLRKLQHPLPTTTTLQIVSNFFNSSAASSLTNAAATLSTWITGSDIVLAANSFVVFNYTLLAAPNINSDAAEDPGEHLFQDSFVVHTDFNEFKFPVSFKLSNNYLVAVPETIAFKNCYIGTVHSKNIKVYSTFEDPMPVLRLSIANNDSRFYFAKPSPADIINGTSINPLIRSKQVSNLFNLINECYVGIPLNTPDGQWFAYGLKLPQNLAEIDSYLYSRLRRKWNMLASHKVNTTILLDTPRVKNFEIPVEAELTWPKLLSHSVVHFPLTAIGNFTIVNLTLQNPSTRPVIVQLLPLVIYPDAESMLEFFREEFPAPLTQPVEMNETLMFSLRDTELFTLKPGSPVPKLREELEKVVGGQVPRFTLSMILQPGMKTRVRLGFLPSDYVLRSSLLLIRNNLTGLEPVVLYGQGHKYVWK
uniref:Transmembrane protein 131-like conserved domain-containing protein n=1 Tax=Ditylenchus dipsaci TaxID=166011 RepID=A0A915DF40_9BILA